MFRDTGFIVQKSSNSEKFNFSSENPPTVTPTVTVQRPPLSSMPVALAITPAITHKPIHIPNPSDIDLPPILLPLTKSGPRKSKSFKRRKSIDAKICDNPTTSALQNKIDEPYTSVHPTHLKTASDLSSETFSLLYRKLSSTLNSTSSVDGCLKYESKKLSNFTLTTSSQIVAQS